MNEVRELAGLVTRKEEARAANEEDLCGADARRVELVVHDDRAGAVECDPTALIAKPLRGAAVGLAERLAQRDFDPRGEVVVVLLARQVRDLLGDVSTRIGAVLTGHLAEKVEAAFRTKRGAERRLAHEDDVGRSRTKLGGRAGLRDDARLSHRWRV